MFALSSLGRALRSALSAPRARRSTFTYRPRLEPLEERWALAAGVAPTAAMSAPLQQADTTTLLSTPVPSAIPGSPTAQPLQTGTGPAQVGATVNSQSLLQSLGQLPVPSFFAPLGYPGRIVFPGTGIDVRAATGDGPLSQAPGIFQVGGGGTTEMPEPPRKVAPPPAPLLPLPGTANVETDTVDASARPPATFLASQETSSIL
jgi:hypothetical protein